MTREERQEAIAQLVRISRNLASIGETVDYTEFAIEALQEPKIVPIAEIKFDDEMLHEIVEEAVKNIEIEPKWIPCSEKLPEVHESGNLFSGIFMQSDPVLVYGICEYEENAQFHVVTYCDDLNGNTYWSTELDALTITGVIAWQPLPQPYKAESEDK